MPRPRREAGRRAELLHLRLLRGGDVAALALRQVRVVSHPLRFGQRVGRRRGDHGGAVHPVRQEPLTVGAVVAVVQLVVMTAAVLVVHAAVPVLGLGLLLLPAAAAEAEAADEQEEEEEDGDGDGGADDDGHLLVRYGFVVRVGVVEGEDDLLLHDAALVLGHAEVLPEVLGVGVGDGEVEPLAHAVGGYGLVVQVVRLF